MIASVRGKLTAREPALVVEVGGLGLGVHVSARTAAGLPELGGSVFLHSYLHVREDQLALYGFGTEDERALFLNLLSVSGVGPRLALTILSSAPFEELGRAIQGSDEAYLVRLPGVGRKTAARLIVELQSKVTVAPTTKAARVVDDPVQEEAVLALVSLGLNPRSAREAIEKVESSGKDKTGRVEDLVKAALRRGAPS